MDAYVHWSGSTRLVKERESAEEQSRVAPINNRGVRWLDNWILICGVDGLEHARDRAKLLFGERGERCSKERAK